MVNHLDVSLDSLNINGIIERIEAKSSKLDKKSRKFFLSVMFWEKVKIVELETSLWTYGVELKKRIDQDCQLQNLKKLRNVAQIYSQAQRNLKAKYRAHPSFIQTRCEFYQDLQNDIFKYLNRQETHLMSTDDLVTSEMSIKGLFRSRFKDYIDLRFTICVGNCIYSCCGLGMNNDGSLIGVGSFGRVFLSFEQCFHKQFAVKVTAADQRLSYEKLVEEGTLMIRAADCRYVVGAKSVGYLKDYKMSFIIMEYIRGHSLYDSKLSFIEEFSVLCNVAQGLEELKELGIVHRDLKQENIMVTRQLTGIEGKIVDLGLSCLVSGSVPEFCGTLAYMSPEALLCEPLTCQSDIYSFGLILHELFYLGELNPVTTNDLIINERNLEMRKTRNLVPNLVYIRDDISFLIQKKAHAIIERCLKRNPQERIDAVELSQLMQDLRNISYSSHVESV